MSNWHGNQDIRVPPGVPVYPSLWSLCLTWSTQKSSSRNHQGNRDASAFSDVRPFTILQFAFMQLPATISVTWDQQVIGIPAGTMTLTVISLISTIKTACYQSSKPDGFERGTGEGGEIIGLLKSKKKSEQKPYFGNSTSPSRSYRNEALIPQAKQKRLHQKILTGIRAGNREGWRLAEWIGTAGITYKD